jgi:hypothetical protein
MHGLRPGVLMVAMVPAMLLLCVMWGLWFGLLAGVGLLLRRGCGLALAAPEDVLLSFWAGFALVCGLLQAWHLVLPVDDRALLLLVPLSAAGWWGSRGGLVPLLRRGRVWRGRDLVALLAGGLLLAFLANRSLNAPWDSDSGYYHYAGILWAGAQPVVPGLANLNPLLGYNNVTFLYAALLESGGWQGHSHHLTNSLLLAALLLQMVLYARRSLRQPGAVPAEAAIGLLLTGVLFMLMLSAAISSPGTDYPTSFLALVALLLALRLRAPAPPAETAWRLVVLVLLCVTGLSFKLSFAPYFVLLPLLPLWWSRAVVWPRRGLALLTLAGALLYGLLWLARGIILSGYPLYPATVAALPVDWRLPASLTREIGCDIRAYGFYNGASCREIGPIMDWLPGWLAFNVRELYFLTLPVLLLLATVVAGRLLRRWLRPVPADGSAALLLPVLAGLVFWFLAAPQVRFIALLIWLAVALALWQVIRRLRSTAALLLCAALVIGAYPAFLALRTQPLITVPGEAAGFYGIPWNHPLIPFTTASGLALSTPAAGEYCWQRSLLCTPFAAPEIRLRVPGDLRHGFRRDGE